MQTMRDLAESAQTDLCLPLQGMIPMSRTREAGKAGSGTPNGCRQAALARAERMGAIDIPRPEPTHGSRRKPAVRRFSF